MRLGIFGGSFDPVHAGHLAAAAACLDAGRVDRVVFVPAAVSPFKLDRHPTAGRHREAMLRLATAGEPRFEVSTEELDRGGPSYTVDTLERLRENHPHDTLVLVLGPDSLASLPAWHRPERIVQLAEPLVVERTGLDDLRATAANVPALGRLLGREGLDHVVGSPVRMPPVSVRSTDVRAKASRGEPLEGLVPRAVADYILEHGLYAVRPDA